MLTLPPTLRVYLAPGATDMRKSFSGLAALAEYVLEQDPLSGHLFAFCSGRRNLLKLLLWDGGGFWIFSKRLEQGTFEWPCAAPGQTQIVMTGEQLNWILGGLDLKKLERRKWWRRVPSAFGPSCASS